VRQLFDANRLDQITIRAAVPRWIARLSVQAGLSGNPAGLCFTLKDNNLAVVGGGNVGRGFGGDGIVVKTVGEVGEQRLLRLQFGDHVERLVQAKVRDVRLIAHGVQQQQVQVVELIHRVERNKIDVGDVGGAVAGGGIVEAVCLYRDSPEFDEAMRLG
jgi:hypothetical protein